MNLSSSLFISFVRANCIGGVLICSTAFAALPQQEYDAAIKAAYNGEIKISIEKLRKWQSENPKNMRIIYDLASLLDLDQNPKAALEFYDQIMSADSPAYAIKAIAHAARAAGRFQDAETAYSLLITKTPKDAEAHAGLAYAWMGQGKHQTAYDYTVAFLPELPSQYKRTHVPMVVVLAELREQKNEWLLAASTYQEILRLEPQSRYAIRGRVFATRNAGLHYLAQRLAERTPEFFNAEEMRLLTQDTIARTINFGEAQINVDDKQFRFSTTDLALTESEKLTQRVGKNPTNQFDHLVALRDRVRMKEAVDLYESLLAEKLTVPIYARIAAADAYLYLQNPEMARDIYLAAITEIKAANNAPPLNWQIALLYAFIEAEQFKESDALMRQLTIDTPKLINKDIPGVESSNPDYARIQITNALVDLYSDRLASAEKSLAELRAYAPFNSDIRSGWASLQSARERPRAALNEYTLLRVDEPKSVTAAVGQADALLTLKQFSEAKAILPSLLTDYPENKLVQRLAQRVNIYDRAYLKAETTFGHGGSVTGPESTWDVALYSAPLSSSLGDRYRVFSHLSRASGDAQTGSVSRTRIGAGLDYRTRDIALEGEVNRAIDTAKTSGLALTMSWDLSDAWHIRANVDTNVNDLPSRAVANGITGESMKLGLTWSLNESRKIGGELSRTKFSDGNIRNASRFSWTERWISGPLFKLETIVGGSASTNSATGRNYFNPSKDHQIDVSLNGEWLTWRRYQRAFKQRAGLTVGQYWQQDIGSGLAADVRYEHEWTRDDELTLRYGVSRGFQPHDGARDYRNSLYLNFYMSLP